MEAFRKTVKRRIALLSGLVLLVGAMGTFDVFWASETLRNSKLFNFQLGMAQGLGFLALLLIVRYGLALRDERKLRLRFNQENDERRKAIRVKAGMPMLLLCSLALLLAGMVAGYFNETVFATLVVAAVCQMVVAALVKLVYSKRM